MPVSSTTRDLLTDSALTLGATQLGEPLTDQESSYMLRTFQRLLDSMSLERGNIRTIRQDTYPLVAGQQFYTIGLDPRSNLFTINSATNANPCSVTLDSPHGLAIGVLWSVNVTNLTGAWQGVNGDQMVMATSTTALSLVNVNSTAFGALTFNGAANLQIGGQWDIVRPTRISYMNLQYPDLVISPMDLITAERWSEILYFVVSGPPIKVYNDYQTPLSTIGFYPTPDQAYSAIVYTEQQLQNPLTLDDQLVYAQGYERYVMMKLAIECGPAFGVVPSPVLVQTFYDAEEAVKSKNRECPDSLTDPEISGDVNRYGLYNYRLGMSS